MYVCMYSNYYTCATDQDQENSAQNCNILLTADTAVPPSLETDVASNDASEERTSHFPNDVFPCFPFPCTCKAHGKAKVEAINGN